MSDLLREPKTMLPVDMQSANEYHFSRKHIDKYILNALKSSPEAQAKIDQGVDLINAWRSREYYPSKNARLLQLEKLNIRELVESIFVGIAYVLRPETFVSVSGALASRLHFDDKADSILTVAEILAVLCETDVFDIEKAGRQDSLYIVSRMQLPDDLIEAIERSMYMPPMVCHPKPVTDNFTGPHLTFKEGLILGKGNMHEGDICLDVINLQNSIELQLAEDFLNTVEETPNSPPENMEQARMWKQFKAESYRVYKLLINQGNRFWLTNKVDKRGRLYAQGYHVTSQGTSFKKAIIELANEEIVDGVPTTV